MISIDNLRYRSIVIDALKIEPGITSVIGANGSGKTTLLKLCAGIALPTKGTIIIDGVPPRETEIGWVNEFPDRNILFETASDEIASPLRFRKIPCQEIAIRVSICMESLGISPLSQRSMRELSGGEKVLVALAAAMINNPHVLLLDECDSHLDAHRTDEIETVIRKGKNPYIIHCTQQMEMAARGDHVVYLENGSIGCAGSPKEVFASLTDTPFYPLSWRCKA
jgi:energy-coupling factor transport system ATP-binding protein